jgi:hypothetical protein
MGTALHTVSRCHDDAKPEGRLEQNPWRTRSSFGSPENQEQSPLGRKGSVVQEGARRDDELRRGNIAKILLEHGTDVDRDCGSGTPLRIAVPRAQFEVVKALFDWGPDDRGTTGGRGSLKVLRDGSRVE